MAADGMPPLEIAARRLTLSQTVEKLIAALARSSSEHSTVKLTRNARGETQIEVSVRTGEGSIDTIDEASVKARQKYDELRSCYPSTVNGGGADN